MGESIRRPEVIGRSDTYKLNFLWRSERLYVMDNHCAALWCWWQHLDEAENWHLLHVDRHYDALRSYLNLWVKHLPPRSVSLDDYMRQTYPLGREPYQLIIGNSIVACR